LFRNKKGFTFALPKRTQNSDDLRERLGKEKRQSSLKDIKKVRREDQLGSGYECLINRKGTESMII